MSVLEEAWKNAHSLRAEMEFAGLEYIGTITRGGRDYLFYKDLKGEYWYDSKPEGKEKPEWQQEAEHEARRRKYYSRNH